MQIVIHNDDKEARGEAEIWDYVLFIICVTEMKRERGRERLRTNGIFKRDREMRTRATRHWLRPVESTASLLWRGHARSAQA